MSSCKEISSLLERYTSRELSPADVNRVDSHVNMCDACAKRVQLLEREADLLRAALVPGEVPPHIGNGVWQRLHRSRGRWMNSWWYAAAVAASIVAVLCIGLLTRPRRSAASIGRVDLCSGPLEVRTAGRGWAPLATNAILRDGDRLRCGHSRPGTIMLNRDYRLDLNRGTELALLGDRTYGRFGIELHRGNIRTEFARLRSATALHTPLADIALLPPAGPTGRIEIELVLSGLPTETGLLGGLSILPAAYAGSDAARLEVRVYQGVAAVSSASGKRVVVSAGEQLMVTSDGVLPEPIMLRAAARSEWWEWTSLAPAGRSAAALVREPMRRSDAKPVSATAPPDIAAVSESVRVESSPKPGEVAPTEAPADVSARRPPAPCNLVGRPDIGSVALSWEPVAAGEVRVVEYGVYRRGAGDSDFVLIGRVPVSEAASDRFVFLDDGLPIGTQYEYAVAAAARDERGFLLEGELSQVLTVSPADFRIVYTGGSDDVANIRVEKFFDGELRSKSFAVRKRDRSRGSTGEIGRPEQLRIRQTLAGTTRPVERRVLIDFSTGYHLVDIVKAVGHSRGVPEVSWKIIIENDAGMRREVLWSKPNGD